MEGTAEPSVEGRVVILHYHLFKNAGTSVDEVLKHNFPDAWFTREFEGRNNLADVRSWIVEHPEGIVFSSHTASLPPPDLNATIIPILFVRHPLDRIRSAYAFERGQNVDTYGSRLARQKDFAGYVATRLKQPEDRQCRNFHTARLSAMMPGLRTNEGARALAAIDHLPFIGLVEAFSVSMERLQSLLQPYFPNFRSFEVERNVSRSTESDIEEKVALIREELGETLFGEVMDANHDDFKVYAKVSDIINHVR